MTTIRKTPHQKLTALIDERGPVVLYRNALGGYSAMTGFGQQIDIRKVIEDTRVSNGPTPSDAAMNLLETLENK